jgi:hypothetical protein
VRKLPTLGMVDKALIALVVLTAAMWLRDQLPASGVELAEVQALAAHNEAAHAAVVATLSTDPSPNRREARQLRERVVAIERTSLRMSEDPSVRAMASERDRLAVIPLSSMSAEDLMRWVILSAGRYVTLIVGTFAGLCGLLVLRGRGRLSRARS